MPLVGSFALSSGTLSSLGSNRAQFLTAQKLKVPSNSVQGFATKRNARFTTTSLLERPKDSKLDWYDNESEVVIGLPIADDVHKKDLNIKFFPKRVVLEVKGESLIGGELEHELEWDFCSWSIEDSEDGEGRELQLCLAKKETWQQWEYVFQDEVDNIQAITEKVFFEIEIDSEPAGRIEMGLYGRAVPRTVENFLMLCTGTLGKSPDTGIELCYTGNKFHRIIPGFMCQGGDITNQDGTGGESIYDDFNFEDESFALKHTEEGILSMANSGPDTNNSQFFITTVPTPHLDGKHVVFGKVLSGMDVVKKMEECGTAGGETSKSVVIAKSGEIYEEPDES